MKTGIQSLSVKVGSGDALDVRRFDVREQISSLFEIKLSVVAPNPNVDFDAIVGKEATFQLDSGEIGAEPRRWTGICNHAEQVSVEEAGLSGYEIGIVPALWLATQRRNHRMFQQISEIDIVKKILGEWGITPDLRITGVHKKRKYRVQYGESDYAFLCRMLEDAGISFTFEQGDEATILVLSDAPQSSAPRPEALSFKEHPTGVDRAYVTRVHVGQRVRPGRYTMRDHDARLPASYRLLATAEVADAGVEGRLERFHYTPGAFLFGGDQGEGTPIADDKGKTRTDEKEGGALAKKRLEAKRSTAKVITFETTATDVCPGVVMRIADHPRADVADGKDLLVVASAISGEWGGQWTHRCEARRADAAYRPPLVTPKPKVTGVESATVVGAAGEEIHTDEFGRVRVHFHWDRESRMDDNSSCWIHVSQPWGGAGFGGSNLPRVGQEVLVDFLAGDPDRPIIVGRVFTNLQKTPYILPDNKTQSGWKSSSSPGGSGYNELMFEDKKGQELLRMQAEKDLHKLVKNDEQVTIGHDRTKLVKNDDALTVGNDRTKLVQNDEDVTIGNDRTKLVQNDESITIGNNRTKLVQASEREVVGASRSRTVGVNESVTIGVAHTMSVGAGQQVDIGATQTLSVGADQSVDVGGSHSTSVGGSHSTQVGGAQTMTVALASAETIGAIKALTVGGAYEVTVGGMMNTQVMAIQTENVGMTKTVTVGKKLEMVCGKAKVTMEASGKITWAIEGGAKIALDDKNITITAAKGGTVTIVGGPLVDINP